MSPLIFKQDTIAAIATPPGEGGIAILRISGPDALAVAGRLFRAANGRSVDGQRGYTVRYGRFVTPEGATVDDGLLTVLRHPHSYTGEDTAELSCHGGRATTGRALELALMAGARMAEPGEFTQRAFLNGRLDLAQAEAVSDVIRARTETARRAARRQLDGDLSQAVTRLKEELIGILAAIEVTIDFSDEVGELEYPPILARIQAAHQQTGALLATGNRGRILREGLHVAIVGRPNVGKSSLLNRLLRTDRAIVTPIAGTTRDLLEETASLGGVPVVLTDTAGIRQTLDPVERIGVERAQTAAQRADLILVVLDAEQGFTADDRTLLQQVAPDAPRLYVLNKCDLVAPERILALAAQLSASRQNDSAASVSEGHPAEGSTAQEFIPSLPDPARSAPLSAPSHPPPLEPAPALPVSALTGAGIADLERGILGIAGMSERGEDGTASVVVANARHVHALREAQRSLEEAERTAAQHLPGDFIGIDLRGALDALGQITGETVNEEIIHRIFHDFCVGK